MNISLTRLFLLIVGGLLIIAGAYYLVQSIPAKDWVEGIFAIIGIAVGFVLFLGKGINVSV